MMLTPRHRATWARLSPRQVALRQLHDALVSEAASWPDGPVRRALDRAVRALLTAGRAAADELEGNEKAGPDWSSGPAKGGRHDDDGDSPRAA